MKIIVLGGDGFCGWPTSLHLSKIGHDIVIIDNLSRRSVDIELEVQSLTHSLIVTFFNENKHLLQKSIWHITNAWTKRSAVCLSRNERIFPIL